MAKMKTYNVNVRLGGNILHSVPRNNITERELYLLSQIHGSDAIVDQKEVSEIDVSEKILDFQLAREYGRGVVERNFSKALVGFDDWLAATMEKEEQALAERMEARSNAVNVIQEVAAKPAATKPTKAQAKAAASTDNEQSSNSNDDDDDSGDDANAKSDEGAAAQQVTME